MEYQNHKIAAMEGFLYINDEKIGEVDLKIVDKSMGVIGGDLNVYLSYEMHRTEIQLLCKTNGNANSDDFRFSVILEDGTVLRPEGGIGVTDSAEFKERVIDIAGVDRDTIKKIGRGE
jgi:hypothetical protein